MTRFILLWGTAGVLEWPMWEILISASPRYLSEHLGISMLMHVGGTILLFFATPRGDGWFDGERLWARSLVLWMLLFPLIGWIISGTTFFAYRYLFKPVLPHEKWTPSTEMIWHPNFLFFTSAGEKVKQIQQEADLVPLVDIFKGSDINLKRGAIELLAQLKTPQAIKILFEHKSDPSPEVRFFINTAFTRIKKSFDDELNAAQLEMKKHPYKISARFLLAKEYLRYAQTGLLDPQTSQYYEHEAMFHLKTVVASPHGSEEAYWALIDLLISHQKWDEALETCQKLEASHHHPSLGRIAKIKAMVAFHQNNPQALTQALKLLAAQPERESQWNASLDWWGVPHD